MDARDDDDDDGGDGQDVVDGALHTLGAAVVPIEQLERSIMEQVDRQIDQQEQDRDERLLERLDKKIRHLNTRIDRAMQGASTTSRLRELQQELEDCRQQRKTVEGRVRQRNGLQENSNDGGRQEYERDRLIREGKLTPLETASTTLIDQRPVHTYFAVQRSTSHPASVSSNITATAAAASIANDVYPTGASWHRKSAKRLRVSDSDSDRDDKDANEDDYGDYDEKDYDETLSEYSESDNTKSGKHDDDDDDEDDDEDGDEDEDEDEESIMGKDKYELESRAFTDDGDWECFKRRLERWAASLSSAPRVRADELSADSLVNAAYRHSASGGSDDAYFDQKFKLPGQVYGRLFEYQRIGVKWLWELCQQKVGGIVGDEMGLGKTIQIIAFLAGLHYSDCWPGAAVIVCPATVMKQWVQEFHEWWPAFRVVIMHSTGSAFTANNSANSSRRPSIRHFLDQVLARADEDGGAPVVVVTTYESVRIYRSQLMNSRRKWGFVVLDEGHKIRNPDADITLCCKQFPSAHRLILSGTPIQNNLTELWSLFDFVFPGRLGTLPVFQSQFAVPIRLGGYANASAIQVQAAYKCACILRDLINPYLLRRLKIDVAQWMPKKNEQVLFCKLTDVQRSIYEDFIQSADLQAIFDGKRRIFYGIDILRKICNHPDLLLFGGKKKESRHSKLSDNSKYGDHSKSGKMIVVRSLLQTWGQQGHRVLLFTQTRQMQDILEKMLIQLGVSYRRMDGTTPVSSRIPLIDEFNSDNSIFLFLLTTRVGGLGVSLTGADRLIIFDPDWNPSTDMQARERAWRLGQQRDVTIYRLMTSGTIEEKIYHRQIFKQYLTNKILKDPKQRRFFKSNDLQDLFSLAPADQRHNETKDLLESAGDGKHGEFNDSNAADKNEKDQQQHQQDPVLQSLFEMNGLHTVVEHESLMDTSRPERLIIEQEANKIAEDAVQAIRQSRQERSRQRVSVPTWTGRSGTAGVPSNPPSSARSLVRPVHPVGSTHVGGFGAGQNAGFAALQPASSPLSASQQRLPQPQQNPLLSSEQILGNLSASPVDNYSNPNLPSHFDSDNGESFDTQLARGIIRYLNQRDDFKATSSSIISHFRIRVSGETEVILFRKLLKQIARFERPLPSDRGFWILKNEFRN